MGKKRLAILLFFWSGPVVKGQSNLARSKSFAATLCKRRIRICPWMPDPTFYPSPGMAMKVLEHIAYVALLNVGNNGRRDANGLD